MRRLQQALPRLQSLSRRQGRQAVFPRYFIANFLAENRDLLRGHDAEAHLGVPAAAADVDDGDLDAVTDEDALPELACEDQHGGASLPP